MNPFSLISRFIASKASGYVLIGFVVLVVAATLGGFYGLKSGLFKLCDERCDHIADEGKIEELEAENASMRKTLEKLQLIKREVGYATEGIVPGTMPAYFSAVADCLREHGEGHPCMHPSTVPGKQQ